MFVIILGVMAKSSGSHSGQVSVSILCVERPCRAVMKNEV